MSEIIHCYCRRGAVGQFQRVLAVLLEDGRLQIQEAGKTSIVSGGTVDMNCKRCGFEREIALDSLAITV